MKNNFLLPIYYWFEFNKRDLPWRNTSDPYKIWISEIILQQTRVQQGINYYFNFIEKFPHIQSLAAASEDDVLKTWQGLGYYSRARNLHKSAKIIEKEFKGVFPSKYSEILKLKGIGPYTAAAIASIAFQQPYPTIDGNVYRVLSRYFGISDATDSTLGKKVFLKIATSLIPTQNPGFHNQALMEFGALHCTPVNPDCQKCPVLSGCYAFKNKQVQKLPVKSKKKPSHTRFFYYFFFDLGDHTFLEKRTSDNDIWKNLYQFPLFETTNELDDYQVLQWKTLGEIKNNWVVIKISAPKKHILSHQNIIARIVHIEILENSGLSKKYIQVNKKDISKFDVPRLVEHFITEVIS